MPETPILPDPAASAEAVSLLASLTDLNLSRFEVVGNYLRYDDVTRHSLKDLRQRILATYRTQGGMPENFLIWGAPGSGKSYLLQQIATALGDSVAYRELNLARLDEPSFSEELAAAAELPGPVLCLIDEVDSKPSEPWPYERLLPYLEPPTPRENRICYCLAGSGGASLSELRDRLRVRPKGADLLSRVPVGHQVSVPQLGVGDKLVVTVAQLILAAHHEGRDVREIERFALYYVATNPAYSSARQLRSLATECAQRIAIGEDRLRYDDLFRAGDPANKTFWEASRAARQSLGAGYLPLASGPNFAMSARAPDTSAPRARSTDADATDRILVLPFVNISPDPNDEYFADGMTEELIEKLANVGGVRVIARTTAMHYKGSRETALDIGRTLRVGKVVECSVRKAGKRIRITAQLIDTSTEEHLWATRYDRDLDDVFAIQDDISNQISSAISARLAGTTVTRPPAPDMSPPETHDLEAYTLFLHGRKLVGEKGSEESMLQAQSFFEQAVARDPDFARARVGLAEATLWLGGEGRIPFRRSVELARRELETAIAQDERLAEAHAVLAGLFLGEDLMALSEREARRALELNPSLSDAYRWLAQIAATRGSIDETVGWLETAQQLDPVNINVLAFLGRALVYAGREAEAIAFWERNRPLVPFRTSANETEFYLGRRDYARASESLREMHRLRPTSAWTLTYSAFVAAGTGDEPEAHRILRLLEERATKGELMVFFIGFVHWALGETDEFVRSMERAFEMHSLPFLELRYSRLFEAARADPRVDRLLRQQAQIGV